MTPRQQVEQAIREACPELQDLKFGCRVKIRLTEGGGTIATYLGTDPSGMILTTFAEFHENKESIQRDLHYTIIGSPIHLEDVVRAMFIKNKSEHELTKRVQFIELFTLYSLAKTYDQQSDELINFLHPILCGKE